MKKENISIESLVKELSIDEEFSQKVTKEILNNLFLKGMSPVEIVKEMEKFVAKDERLRKLLTLHGVLFIHQKMQGFSRQMDKIKEVVEKIEDGKDLDFKGILETLMDS